MGEKGGGSNPDLRNVDGKWAGKVAGGNPDLRSADGKRAGKSESKPPPCKLRMPICFHFLIKKENASFPLCTNRKGFFVIFYKRFV